MWERGILANAIFHSSTIGAMIWCKQECRDKIRNNIYMGLVMYFAHNHGGC